MAQTDGESLILFSWPKYGQAALLPCFNMFLTFLIGFPIYTIWYWYLICMNLPIRMSDSKVNTLIQIPNCAASVICEISSEDASPLNEYKYWCGWFVTCVTDMTVWNTKLCRHTGLLTLYHNAPVMFQVVHLLSSSISHQAHTFMLVIFKWIIVFKKCMWKY